MGKFKIAEVQLSDIKLVKKNAHFMQQDTFNALVNNIRRDGQLSSVPFCVKHSDGSYTVVSGNHRTQAAKMAGLTSIHVMYIDEEETTNDWLLATQLESVKDINYTVEMPNNEIVPVTLMFVDTQKTTFDKLMETLDCYSEKELGNLTLVDMDTMHRLNEVSAKVQTKYKIKSQALSICKMLEIVNNVLEGNKDGTEV